MADAFLFSFFPEYKCLTGNVSAASRVPQPYRQGPFAFDCRFNNRNRPIFRIVGRSEYVSFQGQNTWMVGPDPSSWIGGITLTYPEANYVPFHSLPVSTSYYSRVTSWTPATRNEIHITCIEDNNY